MNQKLMRAPMLKPKCQQEDAEFAHLWSPDDLQAPNGNLPQNNMLFESRHPATLETIESEAPQKLSKRIMEYQSLSADVKLIMSQDFLKTDNFGRLTSDAGHIIRFIL